MDNNAIILVDDDQEDLELFQEAFSELKVPNEIIVFDDGLGFLEFMRTTNKKPFFILCDINMASIDGLELKKKILEDERLRLKCIPFLFFSTSKASKSIMAAYSLNVQGYFIKPSAMEEIKKVIHAMIIYWGYSQHPNS
jgi:CheY-like chemotaxis protein